MSTLQAKIALAITATLSNTGDFGAASAPFAIERSLAFKNGTSAGQANQVFADKRTLAASANENLDMSGVLLNQLNETVAFTKIRALIVLADATNVNDVVVGGAATNGFFAMFNASTDKIKVKPGGMLMVTAPDANGLAVTATTADLLKIENGGAGTSVGYGIVIIGS